jgi:TonB family protein
MPFFDFTQLLGTSSTIYRVMLDPITITPEGVGSTMQANTDLFDTVMIVYVTGLVIFSTRFLYQLIQLSMLIRNHGVSRKQGMRIVFTDKNYSPFSFFNLIFLNQNNLEAEDAEKIIAHEMVHVRQWHSIDLIILELFTIIQWFNPFIWMYRHAIKTLHEYLADEGVLHSGVDAKVYGALLFEQSTGIQINDLANNFNKSLLKRRFTMMTKKRTSKLSRLKLLFVIPLALTMVFAISFSPEVMAQEKKKEMPPPPPKKTDKTDKAVQKQQAKPEGKSEVQIFTVVEEMPEYPGGNKAMYSFMGQNIKYPEKARQNKVEGTVYVSFVVLKDGSVSSVSVLRGIGSGCDEEAMRVVKSMPNWKPGKQDGKPVNVQYNLPIKFTLAKEEDKKETK